MAQNANAPLLPVGSPIAASGVAVFYAPVPERNTGPFDKGLFSLSASALFNCNRPVRQGRH